MFYFNKTDISNGYLYVEDQPGYSMLYKTMLYMCKCTYTVDSENQDVYNEILNTRYIRLQQTDLNSTSHKLTLVQQQDNDTKEIVITFENKKNKIYLQEFVDNNIIKDDQIWCILLRNYTETSKSETESTVNDETIKIFSFTKDNLNSYNQLILNYSDLGINKNVDIIIEDNNNNIIQNESFVSYSWNNSYLTVTFHKQYQQQLNSSNSSESSSSYPNDKIQIQGIWKLKYLVNSNIKANLKQTSKSYSIILDGTNYSKDGNRIQQTNNIVKIYHNTSDYAFGNIYDQNNHQIFIGINCLDKNTCSLIFDNNNYPSAVNKYTLMLVLTSYYLEFDQEEKLEKQSKYYPATYIKLNQLDNQRANNIIDNLLTPSIVQYRQITIHHETATRIYGSQFKLSYQNWNDGQVYVFLNNNPIRLDPDMYTIDREYGKVYMKFDCSDGDNVMCTYNFDYFPSKMLYGFLQRAVSQINAGPVGTMTSYTFDNCPSFWDGLIADFAYVYCLDKLILDYDIWKGRLIFAIGPQGLAEGNDNIISQLESQRSSAWDRINITLNNPKFKAKQSLAYPTIHYIEGISPMGRYPGLSGNGIVGGRFRGLRINRYGGQT